MANILIAEDEESILRLLKTYFENEGYQVYDASNGQIAIDIFRQAKIDLVCMDIMMPKLTGFEVAKMIRSSSNVPIILLTALDSEKDILKGYSLLIDDYITKPFNPRVLVAKAKNLLLRSQEDLSVTKEYTIGDLRFDFVNNEVWLENRKLQLTIKEFELLNFLVRNKDMVCSREMIIDEIWGLDKSVDNRVIDTYIKKIRKELLPRKYLKTIFKKGYQFNLE